ncbi:replication restart helicase PriA [Chitinophaga pinensis]|uniref:Replication restart protein PriA n=1 Tax=Chitinophaga pinensis (strain ATCC 43595 / DSM 2588 / LMG 13176 / NBRC 15968 / NCIMB 11800 / UQM 2034) TaxID=485918 RepID=A0A979GZG7_CHIPD|nr:primosomal protein N' [Chitinophaga pinensis]ACU63979.1 primosomal protein N' [Chitinophaga pinensis DSM 2588]
MKFADVILPLALPKNYTYAVPPHMEESLKAGSRVAVQLGKQKKYAGIVKAIHEQAPADYRTKPLLDMLDKDPVVYPTQLSFWQWLASYYMCTEGEVLNAALPAHLKLSSETLLLFNDAYGDDFSNLDDDEYLVAEALNIRKELRIDEVQLILDKADVYSTIKKLIEKNVLLVYEELKEVYKEKKENYVQLHTQYEDEELLAPLFNELAKAPKQMELLLAYLHLIKTQGSVLQSELLKKSGATTAQLKGLVDKNILWIEKRVVDRVPGGGKVEAQIDFKLSPAQEKALAEVRNSFAAKPVTLLHGVTSSGKTQLYVKLIEEYVAMGKQVLYLLPEIALTAQIVRRLQKHFGNKIGIYHSRFNNNERVEIWNKVKNGDLKILLGARSSLLLPFQDLGLIILDEEHDPSYKQQDPAPRYHARDAAIYYAGLFRAKVLLGSATPSLESYFNAQQGKYGLVELSERFGGLEMPEIAIVDVKKERAEKSMQENFTPQLNAAINNSVAAGNQVILFQNRRGYAPFLMCATCGWIPSCKNCDVSLTYHKNQDKLHCHYCGTRYPYPQTCAACGSQTLNPKSFGTEKIEDDLQQLFPKARIARMDMDAVRNKDSHNKMIQLLEQRDIDILVGTQMVVKGLDFDNVNLVGILSADSLLSFPDFRVNERAFQLMEQVSGRAGRKHGKGKVIIQASNTRHPVLSYVTTHDYKAMYVAEIAERENFSYPPFTRLLKITLKHKNQQTVEQAAQVLGNWLRPHIGARLVGPAIPLVGRVRNNYLQEMLIKLPRDSKVIADTKRMVQEHFIRLLAEKQFRSVFIVPDVDCV